MEDSPTLGYQVEDLYLVQHIAHKLTIQVSIGEYNVTGE